MKIEKLEGGENWKSTVVGGRRWECVIVDSCSGDPVRVDTLVFSPYSPGRVSISSRKPIDGGPTPSGQDVIRKDRPYFKDANEETPDGGSKVRWPCPLERCSLDVAVTWDTLTAISHKLADAGVLSIELSAIAAILSRK